MYDVAVLGVGTMGAFACMELARRGLSVIGIDQFHPPHSQGSHSGATRVFREAYAEHPDYVPLAVLAGELWEQYGRECGATLLTRCGQINIGKSESSLLMGLQKSAALHGIPIELMDRRAAMERFPMLQVEPDEIGILEPGAGWVDVDAAIAFALGAVRQYGGTLRLGTAVDSWDAEEDGIVIRMGLETVRAKRLIVTAGAWAPRMLVSQKLPLAIQRKVLVWLRPRAESLAATETMPVTTFAERFFYTFPAKDGLFKVAVHWTEGDVTGQPGNLPEPSSTDLAEAVSEAVAHMPQLFGDIEECTSRIAASKNCLYTMTPDEHFVLDQVPGVPVWYAAGFSGHGFKFAPAIGRVLAEMATDEAISVPIDFLSAKRFAG